MPLRVPVPHVLSPDVSGPRALTPTPSQPSQCFEEGLRTGKAVTGVSSALFPHRTSSDSALHTSVMNPSPQDTYPGPAPPSILPGRRAGKRPCPGVGRSCGAVA